MTSKEKRHEWYLLNKEKVKQRTKNYRLLNKNKVNIYKNAWRRKKLKTDINFAIQSKLRSRICTALKRQNSFSTSTVTKLLGCNIAEVRLYLESKFYPNPDTKESMTWENHGMHGWHVDHMQPCCSFNFSKEEEQRKCFHYTNLQPLWYKEHNIKSIKNLIFKKLKKEGKLDILNNPDYDLTEIKKKLFKPKYINITCYKCSITVPRRNTIL